jgi:DNA-binding NarL/FixJ family response regulator
MSHIKVIIADDHRLFNDGISSILQKSDNIKLIGCASDGEELLKLLSQNPVDLVILDISMPRMNGLIAAERIKSQYPETLILVVTMNDSVDIIKSLLDTRVNGILLKNTDKTELLLAISEVCKGEGYFSQKITQQLAKSYRQGQEDKWQLTRREKEVLQCIFEGLSTSEIAERLFISNYTVETHKKNLFLKSGVNKSALLVKKALEMGYLKRNNLSL